MAKTSRRKNRGPGTVEDCDLQHQQRPQAVAQLLAWLRQSKPDIVCLQELKTAQADFPADAIDRAGYEAVWKGEKTWNGVAILSRVGEPHLTRTSLPGDKTDQQSRYIEAAVSGILIGCLYAPNGNPQPGPKFDYKLAWLDRLRRHASKLLRDVPAVLAGDYNVVPTSFDIYGMARMTSSTAIAATKPEYDAIRDFSLGVADAAGRADG